jgi:tetratricopeptide (TPR) repeat protein
MSEKLSKKRDPSEELIHIRQLINDFKVDDANQLIKKFEEKGDITLYDRVSCYLLKCELLLWQGLYEDLVKLAEQTYKKSLGLGKNLLSVDILLIMANALLWLKQNDKLQDIIKQGEELLETLPHILPAAYKRREAYIAWLKGRIYIDLRDADQAIKYLEHSLVLREEFGTKREIAISLGGMSRIFVFLKVDYNRAIEILERGKAFYGDDKWCFGQYYYFMAIIYQVKGELERSIELSKQALTNFNNINNKLMIAATLSNMGKVYRQKGELDRALECLEQALVLRYERGNPRDITIVLDYLIQTLIDKGDLEQAQQYLHQYEQLKDQLKDKEINTVYLLNKALILKKSSRTRNRARAEEIFTQILEDEELDFEFILTALTNLCELLLTELQITNDFEVLEDINPLINRLLDNAERTGSYSILCETYLLQAKLSLLTFDMKKAQRFLTQAQQIAERFSLKLLAIKISNEHDELLKQLTIWEHLKESSSSLRERMEFARLNEQIENMIQKRALKIPELSDEEPVLVLIISQGGNPIFSKSFLEDKAFEDHLFGGFFTAINSFINEMFSEGLDRAIFGEYTLLMNSVSPFLICYVFKGQSYLAQQRIRYFIEKIQNYEDVWDTLEKFDKLNKEIQLKDIPSLKLFINDIFIDKNISLIA